MCTRRRLGSGLLMLVWLLAGPRWSRADDVSVLRLITESGGYVLRHGNRPDGPVTGVKLKNGGRRPTGESFLSELGAFPELETLDLGYEPKGPYYVTSLKQLPNLPQLRTLNLDHSLLDDSGLAGLERFPQLQVLSLLGHEDHMQYSRESGYRLDLAPLKLCTPLRELILTSLPDLVPLKALPHLETLRFEMPPEALGGEAETPEATEIKSNLLKLREFPALTTVDLPLSDLVLVAFSEAGILHKHARATAAMGARPRRPQDVIGFDLSRQYSRFDQAWSPRYTPVSDAGLKTLVGLSSLQSLDLSDTIVTDAGLSTLQQFPQLRSVKISYHNLRVWRPDSPFPVISDEGVKILSGLPTLQSLTLEGCRVTDRGLAEVRKLGSLQKLVLRSSLPLQSQDVTDAGLEHVAALTELRSLTVAGYFKITADGLQKLQSLKPLRELHFEQESLADADLTVLSHFPELRKLRLALKEIKASTLAPLASLKHLQLLELAENMVEDNAWNALRDCPALTRIRMSPDDVTDGTVKALREAGLLQTLDTEYGYMLPDWPEDPEADVPPGPVRKLRLPKITDDGVSELKDLHHVEHVDLSSSHLPPFKVEGPGLKALAGLPQLRTVSLPVTDSIVVALSEVDRLHLLSCMFSHDGGRPANAADIVRLDLVASQQFVNQPLTGVGLRALKPLVNMQTLIFVNYGHQLREDHIIALAEVGLLHTLPQALTKDGRRPKGPADVATMNLGETRLTQASFPALLSLKNLRELSLSVPQETNLVPLEAFAHLEFLHASDGGKPPAGIVALKKRRPMLRIRF